MMEFKPEEFTSKEKEPATKKSPWRLLILVGTIVAIATPLLLAPYMMMQDQQTEASPTPSRLADQHELGGAYRLGCTNYAKGDYGSSVENFTTSITQAPKSLEPYLGRASANYQLSRWDVVIKDMNDAIKLYPQAPQPYRMRACAYYNQRRWKEVIPDATRVLELDPKDPDILKLKRAALHQLGKTSNDDQNRSAATR